MQLNHSKKSDNANSTNDLQYMLVEDLNISEALSRRLIKNGIVTWAQLLSLCTDDLQRLYWIGKGSVREIQNAVVEAGFEPLGTHSPRQTIKRGL